MFEIPTTTTTTTITTQNPVTMLLNSNLQMYYYYYGYDFIQFVLIKILCEPTINYTSQEINCKLRSQRATIKLQD